MGPVRFIFDREDGIYVDMELAEYTVRNGGDDYFPLSIMPMYIFPARRKNVSPWESRKARAPRKQLFLDS